MSDVGRGLTQGIPSTAENVVAYSRIGPSEIDREAPVPERRGFKMAVGSRGFESARMSDVGAGGSEVRYE